MVRKPWEWWKSDEPKALLPGLGQFSGGLGSVGGLPGIVRRPKVRPQFGSGDGPLGSSFDATGEGRGNPALTTDCPMDLGIGAPDAASKLCDGKGESVPEVHTLEGSTIPVSVKPKDTHGQITQSRQIGAMAKWIYREALKDAVEAYKERTGATLEDVAREMGTSLETLHGWLYSKIPGFPTLQKFSKVTGVSVTRFIDDPGAPPEGTPPNSGELDRFLLRAMGSDISKLTPEQKQNAFEVWRANMRGYGQK